MDMGDKIGGKRKKGTEDMMKTPQKKSTEKKPVQKKSINRKKAEDVVRSGAEKVKPADVEKVLKRSKEIGHTFETAGPLGKFLDELKALLALLGDYWSGQYRDIPYWTIAAIVAALLYVLCPVDLIPDFIPVVGYLDDAAVVAACIALVRQDLSNYKKWKAAQSR